MTRFTLWMFALASLATTLNAQSLAGSWQGTLIAGKQNLRLVFKISVGDDDKLKAVSYSIDQGGQPIPVRAITRDGSTIKMTITAVGGAYEGKLSADGNTITGTFTQGAPLPLVLTRATAATEWGIPDPPPPAKVMPADAKPQFEVATIKPSQNPQGFNFSVNGSGRFSSHNTTLKDLIKISYGLHPKQITGGPLWMEEDKYDIIGKPDTQGMPSLTQLLAMVQQLLPDRFHLQFHREKKEMSAYALTVGKDLKIDENTSDPKGLPDFTGSGPRGLRVTNGTMQEFCEFLQAGVLDQPVVDQTGLGAKHYNFILKWTPDGAPAAADNLDAPPDIYTAVQQQLGLRLQSTKAPVDLLVIDHVEKPTEN